MIDQTNSHYKILEKLGQGGMGVVYKAEDLKLKREVAIKFLPYNIASNEEERRRFEIEAQAAASLNHPNISTIYSIEEAGENVFIVMEYIDGVELKDKIKFYPLSADEVINIAIQIAEGLEVAHKKGVIHRDIKSSNIMLTKDGKVKIMDFGLAKIGQDTHVTKIGTTLGTVSYMSPEQSRGDEVDNRTDIWSFGVVLYELLHAALPFKGGYDQAVVYAILNEEPEFADNISPELKSIITKALSKDPGTRYQNVKQMFDDLINIKKDYSFKGNPAIDTTIKVRRKVKSKLLTPAIGIIAIVISALAYFYFNNQLAGGETSSVRKMIVVLPFENLGSAEDNYFADGMTEEITSKLASIGNIGVISRSSALQFAKLNKSTKDIGKDLGVDYILEGTVRWAKGKDNQSRVRITPQLIRVSDDTHIWADSYNRVLDDIFSVQNEIAQKVVNKLGGTLTGGDLRNQTPPTENLEAYDYYLKALSFINRGSSLESDVSSGIKLLEKAIELDPDFAEAYAELSKAHSQKYWFYFDRNDETSSIALSNAQKALSLNPDIVQTHITMAFYHYWVKLDYPKAIEEFKLALKLQPNNPEIFFGLGAVYRRKGNFDLAITNMEKACELDPLSTLYLRNLAETYSLLREFSKSEKYYLKTKELNPAFDLSNFGMSLLYIQWKADLKKAKEALSSFSGNLDYLDNSFNVFVYLKILEKNYDAALRELDSAPKNFEDDQFHYTPNSQIKAFIYGLKNDRKKQLEFYNEARLDVENLLRKTPDNDRFHSSLGIQYAGLGDKEKALRYGKEGVKLMPLEKEAWKGYYRQVDMAIIYLMVEEYDKSIELIDHLLSIPGFLTVKTLELDPRFDPLRKNPKFTRLIEKYSH